MGAMDNIEAAAKPLSDARIKELADYKEVLNVIAQFKRFIPADQDSGDAPAEEEPTPEAELAHEVLGRHKGIA